MNNPLAANILVFDSGVGGLSIVQHIRQQLPTASINYLADNKLFPYGLLDDQTLITRVIELVVTAVARYQADIVVIACNTASTLVLPALRHRLDIPVVGVVPAIKPAAQQSQSKVIGLLATPGTIQRDYTDDLIADFANDCEIIRVGSSKLVTVVEDKLAGHAVIPATFNEIIALFHYHPRWQQMDTMVLACTHFPLVKDELAKAAPQLKYWVDSGDAIARRVHSLLHTSIPRDSHPANIALFTDCKDLATPLMGYLQTLGFCKVLEF